MAECIGNTQDLLKTILADEVKAASKVKMFLSEPGKREEFLPLKEEILKECHQTFCACFHAFFPTGTLKWHCLCDLLIQLEPVWSCIVTINRVKNGYRYLTFKFIAFKLIAFW